MSTTSGFISDVIRVVTYSTVSHAALYAGNGEVIEAITPGVVLRTLEQALADDALAVAYRSPDMTPAIANKIVRYTSSQIGTP